MSTHRRFDRAARLLGDAGIARLGAATVTVFGVGGVGSFAAEALVRSGVGRVILVDYDRICVTNVNRQLHAMKGTLGKSKVEVMADRLANEYQLEVIFEASPYAEARWIAGDKADLEDFQSKHRSAMGVDIDDQPVYLAKSAWDIGYATERYPKVRFERAKERA